METDLYKIRSIRACFRAAYDLFCSNLRTLFKKTWLPVLALSAISSLAHLIPWNESVQTITEQAPTNPLMKIIALSAGVFVMGLTAIIWTWGCVFSLLNGRSRKMNWLRLTRAMLVFMGVIALMSLVSIGMSCIPFMLSTNIANPDHTTEFTASGAITIGTFMIWAILLVPTTYTLMKYMMEPNEKVGCIMGKSSRQGWRHWGFLFVCILVAYIISLLAFTIVKTPELILFLANQSNEAGKLMGDASGLPSYFGIANYLVSLSCTFVWSYLTICISMVFYYAYGTIEAKRRAATQTTQK